MTSVIAISLMLSCGMATNCVDFPKMDGGTTRIQPDVKMVIQEADLKEFDLVRDTFVQQSLSIALNADASSQLAELTREHVGHGLALVVDGQVISEPSISTPIQNGQFHLTAGSTSNEPFWEKVPWMKAKLAKTQAETAKESSRNLGIYVVAALVLLGGSLAYAFGIKKTKGTSAH
jgi:hypothetical protein